MPDAAAIRVMRVSAMVAIAIIATRALQLARSVMHGGHNALAKPAVLGSNGKCLRMESCGEVLRPSEASPRLRPNA